MSEMFSEEKNKFGWVLLLFSFASILSTNMNEVKFMTNNVVLPNFINLGEMHHESYIELHILGILRCG